MSNNVVKLTAWDNTTVEFVNTDDPMSGAMKDVYFSPDKSYVVAFFKDPLKSNQIERLKKIVGDYRTSIFNTSQGSYWEDLFCWPTKMVTWGDKTGLVCPTYNKKFFFDSGKFKGKEKEGKWFASAKIFNRFIEDEHKGNWFLRFRMCIQIARAVRRMHAAGLSHSDLSYKNVLVDPKTGSASVIDIDGLVVPGKYPPEVVGTPDFIAPEVVMTQHLPKEDKNKVLPSKLTDLHALAVLIYMYLFNRHPLRGAKVHSQDSEEDEKLSMGEKALFIENKLDKSNRPNIKSLEASELPQGDIDKRPYTLAGPFLAKLFEQAFVDGLHDPKKRPSAQAWEDALIKTVDLMQPCSNPKCLEKWFVFDNKKKSRCPFCGQEYKNQLPVLDFYYTPKGDGKYQNENVRLMVYDKQSLFKWHINRTIAPNEKLSDEDKRPLGDFQFFNGRWILINRTLDDLYEIGGGTQSTKKLVAKGSYIVLNEGTRIMFSSEPGGRLAYVSVANK